FTTSRLLNRSTIALSQHILDLQQPTRSITTPARSTARLILDL
ncbi:15514_t:CDS:1, partial [Dentiscutata heterogama]